MLLNLCSVDCVVNELRTSRTANGSEPTVSGCCANRLDKGVITMSSWGPAATAAAGGSLHVVDCYRMAVVGGTTPSSGPQHADAVDKERALRAAFSFRPTAAATSIGAIDSDGHHRLSSSSSNLLSNAKTPCQQQQQQQPQQESTASGRDSTLAVVGCGSDPNTNATLANTTAAVAATDDAAVVRQQQQQQQQLSKHSTSTAVTTTDGATATGGTAPASSSTNTTTEHAAAACGVTEPSANQPWRLDDPASSSTQATPENQRQQRCLVADELQQTRPPPPQQQPQPKQPLNYGPNHGSTARTNPATAVAVSTSPCKDGVAEGAAAKTDHNDGNSSGDASIPLPRSTMPFDQQIAGHRHGHGKTKLGMLRHQDGSILKPLVPNDVRANREHEFYLFLEQHRDMCPLDDSRTTQGCDDAVLHQLAELTPRYLGVFETDFAVSATEEDSHAISYMKLEDLCQGFQQPCIADVKIGRVTHDPEASAEKIEQSVTKYPAQWDIGYRILGMRVFEQGRCHVYDAGYGLQQSLTSVPDAVRTFTAANPACVPLIVDELQRIHDWFNVQRRFAFYSSSILFVYDAAAAAEPRCSVKLIDFAHVFPTETADENYLFGLRNLIDAFRAVAAGSSNSQQSAT